MEMYKLKVEKMGYRTLFLFHAFLYSLLSLFLIFSFKVELTQADIVYLKNGSILEGEVKEVGDDKIEIKTKVGVISFSKSQIDVIEIQEKHNTTALANSKSGDSLSSSSVSMVTASSSTAHLTEKAIQPAENKVNRQSKSNKKVMAFYYPWYGTPDFSGKWIHWDEGGHNPNKIFENGRRDTGTTDYPLEDLYDSNDPAVIRKHFQMAKRAGIDVFIVSWWGKDSYTDRAFATMLKEAEAIGTDVALTIYYETVPENSSERAKEELQYILARYSTSSAFFKINNSRPVIFIYSRALSQLSVQDWTQIITELKKQYKAFFIFDTINPEYLKIADGGHIYNPAGTVARGADMAKEYSKLANLYKRHGIVSALTVIPGYDDSNIGRNSPLVVERKSGQLYEQLWESAIKADPDWILITSFNEWHEGTEIEPSIEYSVLYILLTERYSSIFKNKT